MLPFRRGVEMRMFAAFAGAFLLIQAAPPAKAQEATAPTASNGAIPLAALIAENSPVLTAAEKAAMAKLLDGESNFPFPANEKILITVDSVVCRASHVDILSRSCELTFGKQKVSLTGRRAHELFATIGEAGVRPEGAAGSTYEGFTNLKCTVDPTAAFQADGEGADCTFKPGPPT